MREYYGTKRVVAWEQCGEPDASGAVQEGYAVKYADNYIGWLPRNVFEDAYQPIHELSFGHALKALKAGAFVARASWENRYYVCFQQTLLGHSILLVVSPKTGGDDYEAYTPSQRDMLINDWYIVCDSSQYTGLHKTIDESTTMQAASES